MKKFLIQVVALFVVIIAFTIYDLSNGINLNVGGGGGSSSSSISQVKIGDTTINVTVADTSDSRAKGLGGVASLASDSGMLFVFPTPGKYSFWMKGMNFGLDFIWINKDSVVDLLPDIPAPEPNTPDASLPIYQPVAPVDHVLEVNQGFISQHNIKVGDKVEYINK